MRVMKPQVFAKIHVSRITALKFRHWTAVDRCYYSVVGRIGERPPISGETMKQLLLLFALLAACSLGCEATTNETAKNETAKATSSESSLLAEVDAAGLETTMMNNSVTLVEFTAEW